MFLVPYILEKKQSIYPVYIFHIFLNQGTVLLQMDQAEIEDFCNENGFYYNSKTIKNNTCFLEINTNKTDVKSFYFYTENVQLECFRRFVLIGNYEEDFLEVNDTNPEFIIPVLKTILDINKE